MPKLIFLRLAVSSINSLQKYIYTRALRLLALRGWQPLCVRRRLPSVAYKGDNISKYVHLSVKTDFTRKITKFVNFKIFDA